MNTSKCLLITGLMLSLPAFPADEDRQKREAYLEQLLSVLPPETYAYRGQVTPLDATWIDWLERTGELPPDFDKMPSIPFLPDPFVFDEGGKNIPVTTMEQWEKKCEWISKEVQHWITGTFPPAPDNLVATIISETIDGDIIQRRVELRFGPDHKAKMTVELMIPKGDGPFPVFLTQWNHKGWAHIAVRRGYIGCVYYGCDAADDTELCRNSEFKTQCDEHYTEENTETYADIWYPEYDFTRLMRRAWGAHRTVDYLYTLAMVDKEKIALCGHSRNGKQSLMAAAFDERIAAVVPTGGTAAEVPFRYACEKYDDNVIVEITNRNPYWLHPRLRFFIGREHKLPVDQNLLMSLVAPRGLMLSASTNGSYANPLGTERLYRSMQRVYKFHGAEDKLHIRIVEGTSDTAPPDIEAFIDFFDSVFGRSKTIPGNKIWYDYSFDKWLSLSNEIIDPLEYPDKKHVDLMLGENGGEIKSSLNWEKKKEEIRKHIQWALGDEPPGVTNPGPQDHLSKVIDRNQVTERMSHVVIAPASADPPYRSFGDHLSGNLYYPLNENGKLGTEKLPVVIFLHEYAYASGFERSRSRSVQNFINGFTDAGYAVFMFDQIGFGTRIEEGTLFYERYPNWSKMGRMVADTRAAVEAMANLEIIDRKQIYVAGYALGATVGLYATALDDRIAGVASVCGFTPMRLDTEDKGTEGIRAYSHLHGLLPRLGFFVGKESRIPYDYNEILACIAPRPLLVIAPTWDRHATFEDVSACVEEAGEIYGLYGAAGEITFHTPSDYNRFSNDMQQYLHRWAKGKILK